MTRLRALGITGALLAVIALGLSSGDSAAALGADAQFWPRIVRVPAGGDLQAALDAARPGDFIELPAGATFVGNFTLPKKPGKAWIVIYSSAFWRLPRPGTLLSPADADLMPKIVTPNGGPAISTAAGAHHYAFVGIEVTTTSSSVVNLVKLETPEQAEQTMEQLPTDITLYRCYIHGTPTGDIRRGVALNGARLAVIGSYLSDFHERNADSQAIAGWKGPGPFTIAGNYLEAAGENVMFGGGIPTISGLVPSDIEIRGNHFFKPLSWREGDSTYAGIPWVVKNLLELKNARGVLVDGNIFENNWTGADQGGFAIVFTPRTPAGAPWSSAVQAITFTHNVVRRSTAGMFLLGWDNSGPSQQLQGVLVKDNLFVDIGAFPDTAFGGLFTGMLFHFNSPTGTGWAEVVIDHNTALQTGDPLSVNVIGGSAVYTGFVFTNNITRNGPDGFNGNANATLSAYFPDYVFSRNILVGGTAETYPPDNFFPVSLDEVGFVDYASGDYRLGPGSLYRHAGTDGKNLGADIAALEAALLRWW